MTLEKESFLKYEPIFARISIINNSDTITKLFKNYSIYAVDGSKINYPHDSIEVTFSPHIDEILSLQPGDSSVRIPDFLPGLGVGPLRTGTFHTMRYLPAGSYAMFIEFKKPDRMKVRSSIVSFRIDEPVGEEQQASELLERATKEDLKGNWEMGRGLLDKLLATYPKSNYRILAYMQKFQAHIYEEEEQTQREACAAVMALIREYPNSEAAQLGLTYAVIYANKVVKNDRDRKELFQRIANDYPGTAIGATAADALTKMN
jgi:hypothetical protein